MEREDGRVKGSRLWDLQVIKNISGLSNHKTGHVSYIRISLC